MKIIIVLLILFMSFLIHAQNAPDGYQLKWSDEFNTQSLDTTEWFYRETKRGDISICVPKNVSIEDSMLRIDMLIENYGDFPQTCGGVISKRNFKYGYFETAVKVDGGDGWHEAFWTSYSNGRNYLSQDPITISRSEIDGLEHYCTHNINEFSYGIIEWWDGGNQSIYREKHSTPHDLNDTLYTWAFEFTPDYFNFFFDGKVIATINSNRIPKNDFFIWLSSIGIRMASKNGVCFFDYFRYYDIDFDSQEYKQRKELFTKNLSIR